MISVRYGAAAPHSSNSMSKRAATAAKSTRNESAVGSAVDREVDPHEEAIGQHVAELLALHDVAAPFHEEAGDGVDDAGAVGTGQDQHEVAGGAVRP